VRIWALLLAIPAWAQVEVHLSYGILRDIVASQVFTEEGRKYVKGNKRDRCTFAYL